MTETHAALTRKTANIVAAYVSASAIGADTLPALIASVYQALANLDGPIPTTPVAPEPAVPIRRSVFPDYIVCLEDGRQFKSLKRHLWTAYGMTPEDYRAKWKLPTDYPIVAPNYAAHRSALARAIGLGKRPPADADISPPGATNEPPITILPERKRGRKRMAAKVKPERTIARSV
ncbi:transcriptional regulator [Gluconacetobacter azotocaptans]|uniref:Transcriptional regulator n=1 Tax=Gluconacetobacter azotocaptans TaxID=142834 RepID=A0A7W4JWB6_9PROT|nr:MucR family transcriptional regulator [Gluconacetobacter azotocaptans]MBB2191975.1 transcriptional regulator [Gluconacetobacter azotocaptans]MBM9401162.1 MucR family transcriptional regulator [Gluconacetobacter azotocaptans]GBQ31960.1 Ros/MucR family transcriptional regulator [Gluconacetobacter azotocaptans DSM 13594]